MSAEGGPDGSRDVATPPDGGTPDATQGDAAPDATQGDAAPEGGLALSLAGSSITVPRGRTASVLVTLSPAAASGGAVVTVTGLESGVTAAPLTIAAGASSGTLKLSASSAAALATKDATVSAAESGGSPATASLSVTVTGTPGSLDTTFGGAGVVLANAGVTGDRPRAEVIQPDGKIVLAGRAVNEGNSAAAMARFNTDGSLDTSFGTAGKLLLRSTPDLTALALQPDAKIVALTSDGNILRVDANGTIDTGFGTAGYVKMAANAIAVQPDGRIVVAGSSSGKMFVARLDSTGALDPTFGTGGSTSFAVSSSTGTSAAASALALETSGTTTTSIVVAGNDVESSGGYFAVARLSGADGSLDTTFNGVGYVTTAVGANSFGATTTTGVLVQPDGKIVLGGTYTEQSGYGNYAAYAVLRYTSAGVLDTTFNSNGIVTIAPSSSQNDYLTGIALQGTSIVGVGNEYIWYDVGVYFFRLNADGSRDTTIGANGLRQFLGPGSGTHRSAAYGVAVQQDGKIVVAGSTFTRAASYPAQNEDFAVLRLDASSASADTTFDTDGWATANIAAGDDGINAVAVQPDEKIVGVGYAFNGADDDILVERFQSDGSLDPTFGNKGVSIVSDADGDPERASAVAIQPDGKIVIAGTAVRPGLSAMEVARLDVDGSLDTTFAHVGHALVADGSANGIALQPDGKILLGGADNNYFVVCRVLSDGSVDVLPGDAGYFPVTTQGDGSPSGGRALALLGSGKFVLAGYSGTKLGLVQYDPDVSLDTSFGGDGKVSLDALAPDGAYALALQTSGKLVVAGDQPTSTNVDLALARLDDTGALDSSFGTAGEVKTDVGSDASLAALLAEPDDKLVGVGYAAATPDTLYAVRYDADGAADSPFGTNGVASIQLTEPEARAYAVARQADGMLLVGGAAGDGWQHDAMLVRIWP